MRAVGRSVPRKDGPAKVTGQARYAADLSFPGMLWARTIRSSVAHGEIASVRLGFAEDDFVVVDYRDIPGKNVVLLLADDQPCLAEREVNHVSEPILLLAHEDRDRLAAAPVHVDMRARPPVLDPEESRQDLKRLDIAKGDVERGLAAAAVVVEGEYRTGAQEHAYLETNAVVAVPQDGGITIYGSLQCPFFVRRSLAVLLGLADDKVRVVQTETGGGFGGKEDYPSMIAGHAALLALKARRPVKLVYDRREDMAATTKRHPAIVRHRTGVAEDGRLLAMDVDVLFDGGAYVTISPVVLSRGVLHAVGPYRCDNVRIRGRVARTNTPPAGAFRGFGAPQTLFAVEVHMERIAEQLGLDPVSLRARNALRRGDTMVTGQRLGSDASALAVLREAVRRSDFRRRRRALRGTNRGIGLSLFFHGTGYTGSGEVRLRSKASLELTPRGARIRVGSTELGQGARTTLAQIVADALGVDYQAIEIADVDTASVPDSGPTVASRTCMIVGGILKRCAEEMKKRLGGLTPREYLRRHGGPLLVTSEYERPAAMVWDEESFRGDAYSTYAWGCDVVEVELDPDTYEVRPAGVTAVHEIGKAINPQIVRGQIEGGVVQGLGWALLERVVMREGRMANANLADYAVPSALDVPPLDVTILERPYRHGPFGAKGLGELPMDGPAPAVVNAIRQLGLDVRAIPAVPEQLMKSVRLRDEPTQ
ncbi:MAG: xanthine dehydrogenase family protein molybdopterin-binding subunit [Pseudomonadota bacterium]